MSEKSKYIQHGWNSQEPITVAKMNNIESIVPSVIAPEYSTELNYTSGDYVTCRGVLYKCKNNTTGDFKQSDWDEAWITGKSEFEGQDEGWPNLSADILNMISSENTNWTEADAIQAANLAETYTEKTYTIGEYCIHNNELFKCTTNITSAESWNSNHWEKATIGTNLSKAFRDRTQLSSSDDILNLKTGIYRKNSKITPINWPEKFPGDFTAGYGLLLSFVMSQDYRILLYFPGANTGISSNMIFFKYRANSQVDWGNWYAIKIGTGGALNINQDAICAEFNESKNGGYSIGDYVIYDNDLYKFTSNHAGTWDVDHVSKTYINNELTNIKKDIISILTTIINLSGFELDNDYIKLDYLESNGNAYVSTGTKLNQDSRVIITYAATETCVQSLTTESLFGARYTTKKNAFTIQHESSDNFIALGYGSSTPSTDIAIDTLKHTIDFNKNIISLDNTIIYTFDTTTFTTPADALLFAVRATGGNTNYFYGHYKIYSCQIYDDETLIRNLIPVKRVQDEAYGFYDTINQEFYGAVGTLVAGNICSIKEACDRIETLETNNNIISSNFAQEFSSSIGYSLGDYAVHNGQLYIYTSSQGRMGPWNENYWQLVTVAGKESNNATIYGKLSQLITQEQTRRESMDNSIVNNLAPQYNENNAYIVGDYVISNKILYKCIQNTDAPAGDFNPNKWESVYIVSPSNSNSIINELYTNSNSNLNNAINRISNLENFRSNEKILVNYYETPSSSGSISSNITIQRNGNRIILNGSIKSSSTPIRINISSNPISGYSTSSWPTGYTTTGLTLISGHKYRLHVRHISGTAIKETATGNQNAVIITYFRRADTGEVIGTYYQDERTQELIGEYIHLDLNYSGKVHIFIVVNRYNSNPASSSSPGVILNNYTVDAWLEDVTYSDKKLENIAPVETSPTRNSHNQGDIIIINENLYKCLINIPINTTLIADNVLDTTKVQLTSMMEIINSIT